jgi:hypothetical protein
MFAHMFGHLSGTLLVASCTTPWVEGQVSYSSEDLPLRQEGLEVGLAPQEGEKTGEVEEDTDLGCQALPQPPG